MYIPYEHFTVLYIYIKGNFLFSVLSLIRHQLSTDPQPPHVQHKPFISSIEIVAGGLVSYPFRNLHIKIFLLAF